MLSSICDAASDQSVEQRGMGDDAGPAARQLVRNPLEDVDMPAVVAQQLRREQPAQRAADDYCRSLPCHAVRALNAPYLGVEMCRQKFALR